jgi:hypothetical protein
MAHLTTRQELKEANENLGKVGTKATILFLPTTRSRDAVLQSCLKQASPAFSVWLNRE